MAKDIETDLDLHNVGRILNSPDPLLPQEVATKNYVDTHIGGGGLTNLEGGSAGSIYLASGMSIDCGVA
jgi:hypothetical protein